jgi:hypothetical protein
MATESYTKLSITVETSAGDRLDDPNAITTTISTEMSDCSVHAWFQLFERVLASAGFQEEQIMRGGTQLAFNECRNVDAMRKVANFYDLHLQEDLPALTDGPAATEPA